MWSPVLAVACLVAVAAIVQAAGFPPNVVEALRTEKNLYVATKRKDGTQSSVAPIWFMFDGDVVYFTTTPGTHKATRIAAGSPVLAWVGSETGPHFVGKAEIVTDPAVAEKMAPAYDQKYWIAWLGFFRPRPDRVRDGKTLIVKVTPIE